MRKKIVLLLMSLLLVFSLVACKQNEKASEEKSEKVESTENKEGKNEIKDGTYPVEVKGYGGPMSIEVAIKDGKIDAINVTNDYETPGVGKVAIEKLTKTVLDNQTIKVDSITGATVTSMAFKSALKDSLTAAGANLEDFQKELQAPTYEAEKTADVIIVGGGGAGLAAAIEASDNGASVIVIEKTGLIGGNTIVCGGIYNAPDPELQEPEGIKDSPELFMQQTLEGGDNVGNPELIKVMTENAYDGLKWVEGMGMEFKDKITQGAGSLYPRTHQAVEPLGTGFFNAYEKTLAERADKVEILYNTPGVSLIMDGDKVVGVNATNPDGSELVLHANKSVVLATGGFAKNIEMVLEHNTTGKWPDLNENVVSTNRDSITGDGIKMAEEVGADLVDMEQLQFLYLGIPEKGTIDGLFNLGAENTIFVNNNGERFVREDGRRDVISAAIFAQDKGQMWYIQTGDILNDEENGKSLEGVPMKYLIENGIYGWVKGETIEELAEKIGCPAENLQKSFDDYNAAVESGKDEFGRELLTKKLETAPFYALPRVPALHHTMGGVRIDTECRVLNAEGNPISGLYAAGEITGGIHGANRLGGNAVVDTVVFGRIAGESAALQK